MELIQQYSVSEIIIMLILLAAALKGLINFYDWAKEKILKIFHREQKKEAEKQDIEKTLSEHEERMKSLMKSQDNLNIQIQSLMEKINLLIESDRDDYLNHSIISFNDYEGTTHTFKLYYNDVLETVDTDDEVETKVNYSGLLIYNELEYTFDFESDF